MNFTDAPLVELPDTQYGSLCAYVAQYYKIKLKPQEKLKVKGHATTPGPTNIFYGDWSVVYQVDLLILHFENLGRVQP